MKSLLGSNPDPKMHRITSKKPCKMDAQMRTMANNTKVWFLQDPPCKMLIFACPDGIKFDEKPFQNHIKIHYENYID